MKSIFLGFPRILFMLQTLQFPFDSHQFIVNALDGLTAIINILIARFRIRSDGFGKDLPLREQQQLLLPLLIQIFDLLTSNLQRLLLSDTLLKNPIKRAVRHGRRSLADCSKVSFHKNLTDCGN